MSAAARWHVAWNGGGEARIVSLDGERIVLVSTVPLPPGSRPEGRLVEGGDAVRVKSHGSRKLEDGTFRVEGRALDLRKELRERLAAMVVNAVTS
jgi:hypothetical protein